MRLLPRRPRLGSSFLSEFRIQAQERQRVERILAAARAFLAVVGFVAIYVDPTEPERFAELVYSLLGAYAVYSVALLVLLRSGRLRVVPAVLHALDMAWAVALTAFSQGPISPFFLFFIFTLLAAAFRWGWRETVLTTAITVLALLAEGLVLMLLPRIAGGMFDANRLITRAAYLMMMGVLLAYLAEQQKLLRAESLATSHVMRRPRVNEGLRETIRAACGELLRMFGARAVVLAVREVETAEAYIWEVRVDDGAGLEVRLAPLAQEVCDAYLGAEYGSVFVRADEGRPGVQIQAVDPERGGLRPADLAVSLEPLRQHASFRSFLSVRTAFGQEWEGRLYVFDPRDDAPRDVQLLFLQAIVEHVSPTIYNVYLLRRLRARAGAAERARVARELHDGAIQTLIAAELEVHAVMRRASVDAPALVEDLRHIQEVLRAEILDLRDLMHQLRPIAPEATARLRDLLESLVERFRRETGISVGFACDREVVPLPPRTAVELVRITQEALVNVRKHSGARHVTVRLTARDDDWQLTISDDGRGFSFSGRLSGRELDDRGQGPAVIRERSRAIGAQLAIESTPGRGSRLEILVPARAQV